MNSALFLTPGRWLVVAAVFAGLLPISSAPLRAQGTEAETLQRELLLIMRDEGFRKRLHSSLRGLHNSPTENGGGISLRRDRRPIDKNLLRKLIEEIERRREGKGELLSDLAIVRPQPKAPPRKPKKPPPAFDEDFLKELLERLRGGRGIVIKEGGGVVLEPIPGGSGGSDFQPRDDGVPAPGTDIIIEGGSGPTAGPVFAKIPYISRLFKSTEPGRDTSNLIIFINPRFITQSTGDDESDDLPSTVAPPPPPNPPETTGMTGETSDAIAAAAIFPEDGNEWFATIGAGIHMADFEIELKPSPLIGRLGHLPSSATGLPFSGNARWRLQPSNQRPRTRLRPDGDTLIIDPRSDFERSRSEYASFLNALRQNQGLRGFESDAIRNFALSQDVDFRSQRFSFDDESFAGSVMLGYRQGCCSLPNDDGRFYWQAGVAFSWMDEMSLSTPFVPSWSNDITVNYNRAINRQRPRLAEQLQPISRIHLLGYQSAELDLDAQALALFFGAGYKFACGCRLAMNLMAGYTFQQWELIERQRILANGKRILDAERRTSGDEAIPTLSGMIEAAFPVTDNVEVLLYGGATLSMGNGRRIDTDTIRFGYEGGISSSRFVGLGMSVRF